jgi:hypothetical protein
MKVLNLLNMIEQECFSNKKSERSFENRIRSDFLL